MPTNVTKEQLLKGGPKRSEEIPVPELGVDGATVTIRALNNDQYEAYESVMIQRVKDGKIVSLAGMKAELLIRSVVDSEGKPLFTVADLPAIGQMDGALVDRLTKAAQRINLMTDASLEEARSDFKKLVPKPESGSGSPAS